MKASSVLSHLGVAAAGMAYGAAATALDDIPNIEAYGQYFFYSNNGSQFFMKGVAYQQDYQPNGQANGENIGYTDPLADASSCKRDIPYMQQLDTNVIRVYALDPTADHDDCMEQFAAAGIYVLADLGEPDTSILSDDPSWDVPIYARYTSVIDALAKYNNVIGFFAGNEVVSADNQTAAAAFVKAAVRDTKGYIKSQGYRTTLGVGYATADVPTRDDLAHYFACTPGGDDSSSIDFWGYNVYSWCGDSTYSSSGYDQRYDFFKDYPVPVFFAEYGCIEGITGGPTHRPFQETPVLYGRMSDVFSGGIVYEWFMEDNNYGLVSVNGDSISPYPDFTSLKNQLASVKPSSTSKAAYKPSNTAPACPTVYESWKATASPLPPAVNAEFCNCAMDSLSCTWKSTNSKSYADNFDYICGNDPSACDAIAKNATTGTYGAVSPCDPHDQLAYVADQYYKDQGKDSSACDFSGNAVTQKPTTAATCSSLLSAAGTDGTGNVPSPTGQQGTAIETGVTSSNSDGAAGRAFGAPARLAGGDAPAFFNFGAVFFSGYVILAIASAVGILVL